MGVVFTNNAETTLAAAITSTSATSISVTSSSTFPTVGAGEYFYATISDASNLEIVKVTAVSGTTWTVVRASDNTTARTFANGSPVQLRTTAALLTDIQENIAAKSANQTVYNATAASSATAYDVGINPGVEANAMVFLDGVMQHHDTFSFSGSTLTFDAAPVNGTKIEVIVDNLVNLQSSNLTVDTFTATSGQTDFVLSDTPAAETNLIVFVDGVFQDQDSYTISNNTLTITDGVVLNRGVTVYVINPVNIGTPSDGTVTSAKLSGNITIPGTLTVGSNDVAFDSPTFVVDNANSRVGLGTASPSVPVDIVGDVKMSANLTVDTSTLVVDSTNNRVGIGTTSPTGKLTVQDSSTLDINIIGNPPELNVEDTSSTSGTKRGRFTLDDNKLKIQGLSDDDQSVTQNLFVASLSNGKVHIGGDNPEEKLDVEGAIKIGAAMQLGTNGTGQIGFNRNTFDGNYYTSGLQRFQINGPMSGSDFLHFQNYNSGGTYLDGLYINGGKVGVGVSAPGEKFQVNGAIAVTGALIDDRTATGAMD